MICIGVLCGNLYKLELSILPYVYATLFINTVSSTKRLRFNEKSYSLWHKRLGHISRQIMERLIKDEILPNPDFSNFVTCVDRIKGKLTTKVRNAKTYRCIELLRDIHTDICWSFTSPTMGGYKYFITFIDDYSRCVFVELIREKPNSLEAFKEKVELQQGKKIKVVHYDRGGEYYGKYDKT